MLEQGIRGHHLDYLLALDRAHFIYEQNGVPAYQARSLAEQNARDSMITLFKNMSESATQDPENRDTYLDIIGTDPRLVQTIARSFASAIIGLYREEGSTVCIHGSLDNMCNACAIGEHCHEETYDFERQYMLDIIRRADELEIEYEVTNEGNLNIGGADLKKILRAMNEEDVTFTYSKELII